MVAFPSGYYEARTQSGLSLTLQNPGRETLQREAGASIQERTRPALREGKNVARGPAFSIFEKLDGSGESKCLRPEFRRPALAEKQHLAELEPISIGKK